MARALASAWVFALPPEAKDSTPLGPRRQAQEEVLQTRAGQDLHPRHSASVCLRFSCLIHVVFFSSVFSCRVLCIHPRGARRIFEDPRRVNRHRRVLGVEREVNFLVELLNERGTGYPATMKRRFYSLLRCSFSALFLSAPILAEAPSPCPPP